MASQAGTLHVHSNPDRGIRSQLTPQEARALTDRINRTADDLYRLLHESYERGAWIALGYDSWRDYAQAEFTLSQSRVYQLLDQGRVIADLEAAAGISTTVEISERAAREIKPVLEEVKEEIRERVQQGTPPAEAVTEVVQAAREIVGPSKPAKVREPEPAGNKDATTAERNPTALLEAQLAAVQRRLSDVLEKLAAVEAEDQHRELLAKCAENADLKRQRDSLANELRELRKDAEPAAKYLKSIRQELGVERNSEIIAAIRALQA